MVRIMVPEARLGVAMSLCALVVTVQAAACGTTHSPFVDLEPEQCDNDVDDDGDGQIDFDDRDCRDSC